MAVGESPSLAATLRIPLTISSWPSIRICPGRRFADSSIWLAIANIIAMFDIRKVRDNAGREIEPAVEFTSGSVRCVSRALTCYVN